VAGTNGAVGVEAAPRWSHGFSRPRDISGKESSGRRLLGKFGLNGETPRGTDAGGEARFGALLLDATGARGLERGAGRGFCD
jgi:hypothetical protein